MTSSLIDIPNISVVTNDFHHGPHSEIDHHILTTDYDSLGLNLHSLDHDHDQVSFSERKRKLSEEDFNLKEEKLPHHESIEKGEHHAAGGEHAAAGGEGTAVHHSSGNHDTLPQDICLFLFIMMFIGHLMKQFSGWTGIPYTSTITVVGLAFGMLTEKYGMGRLGKAILAYSNITPHTLLLIFLPALIFESAFNSDWHIFKVELGQILVLAGPMLLVGTFLSALMMTYIFGYTGKFTWEASLMYGSIISATDPVAVVALLKELGASKRLATMIEGESLMNDGTAMVVFLVLIDIVQGAPFKASTVAIQFVRLSGGGVALGFLGGFVLS